MSTGGAIAATTQLLRLVLQSRLTTLAGPLGAAPTVTAVPPDRIQTGATENDQVNVFMYKVTPNHGWRNRGLPSRSAAGDRTGQPPLALDLHYLVSAYTRSDLHADLMLGHAMLVLHGLQLTKQLIEARFADPRPADVPAALWTVLVSSELADQGEQVTLTHEGQTNEDISRLWSVLGEKYRPSAAYVVTVVLLQPEGPARRALPVTQPAALQTLPVTPPRLLSLDPAELDWVAGAPLVVRGSGLLGPGAQVVVDRVAADPEAGGAGDRFTALLPAAVRAGTQPVRVRHRTSFPSGTEVTLQQSNALALVVRPVLVSSQVLAAAGGLPRRLRVRVAPPVAHDQAADVLLNSVTEPAVGFTLPAPARPPTGPPAGEVDVDVSAVPAGGYLLRLQVDGAVSTLTADPATGRLAAPEVTL